MSAIAPPSARQSLIPAMVVLVCLPLPAVTALGQFARLVQAADERFFTMIGFASAFGYLVTFLPALALSEPFAIGASIWYTQRWANRDGESFGRVIACWAAVLIHTATIAFYFRRGFR